MADQSQTYDLRAWNLSMFGLQIAEGGADDGFITITTEDQFASKTGVHGDTVTFRTGNTKAAFELKVLSTAPINEDLNAILKSNIESTSGAGKGDFLLEDMNSDFEVVGECMLLGYPEIIVAAEAPMRTYKGEIYGIDQDYRERG
jgi:hypothetical protein